MLHLHAAGRRIAIAEVEAGGDQKEEGQRLQQAGHILRPPTPPHAQPLHQCENGDHRQRDDFHRPQVRDEMNGVLADNDRDRGSGAAGRDPVAPADDESGVIAEGVADKNILAARFRHQGPQLRERVGAQESVEAADDPDREKEPEGRQVRGNFARRPQNARGDGVADDHGQTKGQAENSEKAAVCRTQHAAKCNRLLVEIVVAH